MSRFWAETWKIGAKPQILGEHAHIETIVIDRGYLDGEDLWCVHQHDVIFVICGKSTMAVTQDAQGLARGERASVRERMVRHGHGKTATEERVRTEWSESRR